MKKLVLDTPISIPAQQATEVRISRVNIRDGALVVLLVAGNIDGEEKFVPVTRKRIVVNNQAIINSILNGVTTQEELDNALIIRAEQQYPGTISDIV